MKDLSQIFEVLRLFNFENSGLGASKDLLLEIHHLTECISGSHGAEVIDIIIGNNAERDLILSLLNLLLDSKVAVHEFTASVITLCRAIASFSWKSNQWLVNMPQFWETLAQFLGVYCSRKDVMRAIWFKNSLGFAELCQEAKFSNSGLQAMQNADITSTLLLALHIVLEYGPHLVFENKENGKLMSSEDHPTQDVDMVSSSMSRSTCTASAPFSNNLSSKQSQSTCSQSNFPKSYHESCDNSGNGYSSEDEVTSDEVKLRKTISDLESKLIDVIQTLLLTPPSLPEVGSMLRKSKWLSKRHLAELCTKLRTRSGGNQRGRSAIIARCAMELGYLQPSEASTSRPGLTLEDLVSPLGTQTFLREYWERMPVHLPAPPPLTSLPDPVVGVDVPTTSSSSTAAAAVDAAVAESKQRHRFSELTDSLLGGSQNSNPSTSPLVSSLVCCPPPSAFLASPLHTLLSALQHSTAEMGGSPLHSIDIRLIRCKGGGSGGSEEEEVWCQDGGVVAPEDVGRAFRRGYSVAVRGCTLRDTKCGLVAAAVESADVGGLGHCCVGANLYVTPPPPPPPPPHAPSPRTHHHHHHHKEEREEERAEEREEEEREDEEDHDGDSELMKKSKRRRTNSSAAKSEDRRREEGPSEERRGGGGGAVTEARGLKEHYDDHCVLVLQLCGHKRWLVRPPHREHRLPRLRHPRVAPGSSPASPLNPSCHRGDGTQAPPSQAPPSSTRPPVTLPSTTSSSSNPEGASASATATATTTATATATLPLTSIPSPSAIKELSTTATLPSTKTLHSTPSPSSSSHLATPLATPLAYPSPYPLATASTSCSSQMYSLSPGDVLYVPRGWPHHAACTTPGEGSAHLTLAVEVEPMGEWVGVLHTALRLWVQSYMAKEKENSGRVKDEEQTAEEWNLVLGAEGLLHRGLEVAADQWEPLRRSLPMGEGAHLSGTAETILQTLVSQLQGMESVLNRDDKFTDEGLDISSSLKFTAVWEAAKQESREEELQLRAEDPSSMANRLSWLGLVGKSESGKPDLVADDMTDAVHNFFIGDEHGLSHDGCSSQSQCLEQMYLERVQTRYLNIRGRFFKEANWPEAFIEVRRLARNLTRSRSLFATAMRGLHGQLS